MWNENFEYIWDNLVNNSCILVLCKLQKFLNATFSFNDNCLYLSSLPSSNIKMLYSFLI